MTLPDAGIIPRPKRLLTQNSDLKRIGVWNWTIPAWAVRLSDGRTVNTCPSAGVCAQVCYARHGTYRFPIVRAKHEANLAFLLDDLPGWQAAMTTELSAPRFRNAWIRIHDAGDYFSDSYLTAWLAVAAAHPAVEFYSYTKEVDRFRRLVEPDPPPNFRWVYSYGGRQDAAITEDDRRADVFPDESAITAAGWSSQSPSDLLAVLGPRQVGVPANRIPAANKKIAGRRFSHWQTAHDAAQAARRTRRAPESVDPLQSARSTDQEDQSDMPPR
ncbi:GP88 family protein [Nocardia tengchongensis]|uniref:GP88 family protein n=1 Tax=Nocardia tengchongensis TaxID=2055889 RepID=UPI0036BE5B12